jgi:hypothetical protein
LANLVAPIFWHQLKWGVTNTIAQGSFTAFIDDGFLLPGHSHFEMENLYQGEHKEKNQRLLELWV